MSANREPDLAALINASRSLATVLQRGQIVIVQSTSFPGTTREWVAPILEQSGLRDGSDFHLAFSPERVDPGRTDYTLRNTPRLVGGLTDDCVNHAERILAIVCDQLVRATPEVAEFAKLLENIYLRGSPALAIIRRLQALSAVRYHDPYIEHLSEAPLHSSGLSDATEEADITVIVTAHRVLAYDLITQRSKLLIDLRGVARYAARPAAVA